MSRGSCRWSSRFAYHWLLQTALEEILGSGRSIRNGQKGIAGASEQGTQTPNITSESARERVCSPKAAPVLCSIYSNAAMVSSDVSPSSANVIKKSRNSRSIFIDCFEMVVSTKPLYISWIETGTFTFRYFHRHIWLPSIVSVAAKRGTIPSCV